MAVIIGTPEFVCALKASAGGEGAESRLEKEVLERLKPFTGYSWGILLGNRERRLDAKVA
jgi:hypothetical protein